MVPVRWRGVFSAAFYRQGQRVGEIVDELDRDAFNDPHVDDGSFGRRALACDLDKKPGRSHKSCLAASLGWRGDADGRPKLRCRLPRLTAPSQGASAGACKCSIVAASHDGGLVQSLLNGKSEISVVVDDV